MTKANAGLSRHGPSSPKPGIRTMTTSGRMAADGIEVEPDLLQHPRRVVLDDRRRRSRSAGAAAPGPARSARSSVTLFLLVFSPEKIGDFSHHSVFGEGQAGEEPGAVGAGRRLDVDHLGAEHRQDVRAERAGPERVRSRTRRPLNGRLAPIGVPARRRAADPGRRSAVRRSVCSPSRGAGAGARSSGAVEPVGAVGFVEAVARVARRSSRAPRSGRSQAIVRAVADGRVRDAERASRARGSRRPSCARPSTPTLVGCTLACRWATAATSSRSTPGGRPSRRSRATAGRCRTPTPTRPSLVASTPGVRQSTGAPRHGRPTMSK